jgi:predicted Zn-dependent protease
MKRLLTTLLIMALAACETSPTGRSQLMLVSEADAIAVSADAYRQQLAPYARSGRLDNEAETVARVQAITGRLVAQAIRLRPETAEWQWSIKVLDDPETVNAWAMAGGRMAVYTGLIEQIEPTDDELAQVLGHEIAHALAKHTAEKMSQAIATQAGVLAVGVATGSDAAMQAVAAAAQLAITLPYSRGAESEADRIGIELAARAGFDPRAAVSLWRKMEAVSQGQRPPEFLSTHPSPDSRIQELSALVPQMMPLYRQAVAGQPPVHPVNPR